MENDLTRPEGLQPAFEQVRNTGEKIIEQLAKLSADAGNGRFFPNGIERIAFKTTISLSEHAQIVFDLDVSGPGKASVGLAESSLAAATMLERGAQDVIDACELFFDAYKSDCSGFVRAVAAKFGVDLQGKADAIVDQIKADDWEDLGTDRIAAKKKADAGYLVIGGLKAKDHVPPAQNGHVVVVVSGELVNGIYPKAYWGQLGGVGAKNTGINYAWRQGSRDKVTFSAIQI